ncbi:hypothetical protein [Algiphilus sp.]|uniref:hypothetical protein n=1 Tax=Algiphilus sp. TaxID=1872431 RepID=UPI0032F01E20
MSVATQANSAPALPTIQEVMTDPNLFGEQFGGESWSAWRMLLGAFYGLPVTQKDKRLWHTLTGRVHTPSEPADELWLAVGRRGGKSQCAALLAVYEAAFRDYRPKLSPGEVATVMLLAADRKQARTVMRYIGGLLHSNAMLARMIVREDRESIELSNRTVIEVHTASYRAVRGYTIACVIADEIAFWRSEDSANPDKEIIQALRPAMATLGGKLLALSSPYAKKGELWQTHKTHFGKAGPVLVAQAPSRTMNPNLPQKVVDDALARDYDAARAEYLAEFRSDLASFVAREVVDACVAPGRHELPYLREYRYSAFVDPSGGSADSMTLAIGHTEDRTVVVDAIREVRPPFSPESVVQEFADLMHDYRITKVEGDRYGGEWPRERFTVHRITYEPAAKPRSDLYRDLLPLLNAGRIELPDNDRLTTQLCSLERRTSRGGKDSIDHANGAHDDLANAVAGLAAMLSKRRYGGYTLANL